MRCFSQEMGRFCIAYCLYKTSLIMSALYNRMWLHRIRTGHRLLLPLDNVLGNAAIRLYAANINNSMNVFDEFSNHYIMEISEHYNWVPARLFFDRGQIIFLHLRVTHKPCMINHRPCLRHRYLSFELDTEGIVDVSLTLQKRREYTEYVLRLADLTLLSTHITNSKHHLLRSNLQVVVTKEFRNEDSETASTTKAVIQLLLWLST